ncbi:hypothetical protein SAY86_019774 [Trapa natans]|uniref:Inositol-tetrakisphosphate 1-kinase n=1 Tax=Trapa natans TaxID=22666 RepID=A0AAN7LZE3_TRANT|nr:hypothetical protein SAY86_019774 [Trapa natans]
MADRRIIVGYALSTKKQESFIQDSLVAFASSRGVDLVKIDLERPLADQGPFDCVIHKLYSEDWRRQLVDFTARYPDAVIVDSLDAIERLQSRISMLQVVSQLKLESSTMFLGIPNQIVIYDNDSLFNEPACASLKFPLIAKPLAADGSAESHKLALIFNRDGLGKLNPPIVLQEFVNHGGVIFKVYVVGERVTCVKRKSLPDVSDDKLGSPEGSLSFSQVSNSAINEKHADRGCNGLMLHLENTEMPPQSFINDIARELRQVMKLNLFNFDVIRDARVGTRYLIIDINYFPGYAKMPCYEAVLTEFFCNIVRGREKKREEDPVA